MRYDFIAILMGKALHIQISAYNFFFAFVQNMIRKALAVLQTAAATKKNDKKKQNKNIGYDHDFVGLRRLRPVR